MNKELKALFKKIKATRNFKDLMENDNAGKTYRKLAKLVHPDVVPEELKDEATFVFAHLLSLYGTMDGLAPHPASTVIAGYVIKSTLAKGDICDLYIAESVKYTNVVLKIVRSPVNNDLLEREVRALRAIHVEGARTGPNKISHYVPDLLNTFKASGRRVVIIPYADGYTSLKDILSMYPSGLDFRHIVWMGNRLLSILGYVHQKGYVHGAVLPSHLLYHPTSHDLKLVDWCYSAQDGEKVPAIIKSYIGMYPPEVARKIPAVPETDIYMMASTLFTAAGDIPKRFRELFEHCVVGSPASRPGDAWKLQDTWQSLARMEYGAPTYIPLIIKTN